MIRLVALLLTLLTGFTGLVYEVAWQRYLATLLGSHSEATAAVLAIFLGGLSIGYWLFGAWTRRLVDRAALAGRPPRLLRFYGLVEAGIGLFALCFPWYFEAVRALSYLIPHGAAGVGFAIDVALSVLLIGLPSILMGGTIPVLTQALARSLDDATRFHAYVYAMNTAGAFLGALTAGFYLVPVLGLLRVMLVMGLVNLFAGSVFVALGARGRAVQLPRHEEVQPVPGLARLAAAALLVGFASMALQTIVLRFAGIALGSTQFTFSMVVSVFVLCIALGSFAVSWLPRIGDALIVANQWLLVLAFLALYTPLPQSPYAAYVLRTLFSDQDPAFFGFNLLAFLGVLLLIGPTVILSGASLPLLFHHMRRQVTHLGDVAGTLYSWNTVGSLLGALLAGYALLFWLDLHHVFRIAVAALVVAAVLVTLVIYRLPRAAALAGIPLLILLVAFEPWDARRISLPWLIIPEVLPHTYDGIDRCVEENPALSEPVLLFHDDDPTSTITAWEYPKVAGAEARSLSSDGRSDGSTFSRDVPALRLLALLPALMAEKAERAFVVGFGLGITAGELGRIGGMREVTAVEISPGVVAAAPLFEHANLAPLANPAVDIVISDAYRALMRSDGTYDVIVSQPSHLWVVGVEMVMSREFLAAAREHLAPGGVYGQWLPETGIDDETLALMVRTFLSVFEEISIWETQSAELILLGFADGSGATDQFRLAERAESKAFAPGLRRAGVDSVPELLAHELVPVGVLGTAELEGPVHTLLHPRLNYLAARALFRRDNGDLPFTGHGAAARTGAANSLLRRYTRTARAGLSDDERAAVVDELCQTPIDRCYTVLAWWMSEDPGSPGLAAALERHARVLSARPDNTLAELAELFRRDPERRSAWLLPDQARRRTEQYVRYYHHATPFDPEALLAVWSRCRAALPSPELCRADAQARRQRDPTLDDAAIERLVARCIETPVVGLECQRGLEDARALTERGVVPATAFEQRRAPQG